MLYNYCPKCGGGLREEKEDIYICQKCGFNLYLDPEPANAGIIVNELDEILLVKRAKEPQKDTWDLPGGFVNIKETLEGSFKRELKEELGIDIIEMKYLSSHPSRYLYQDVNKYTLIINFVTRIESSTVLTPADDISDAKFFSLDNIPWGNLAFDYVKEGIEDYINTKRSV